MTFASLLQLVTQLVPVARQVLDALRGAQAEPNPTDEVLDLIAKLSPVAAQLVSLLTDIRTQTEAQHPAVWAAVRADYQAASAQFDALMAAANKPA